MIKLAISPLDINWIASVQPFGRSLTSTDVGSDILWNKVPFSSRALYFMVTVDDNVEFSPGTSSMNLYNKPFLWWWLVYDSRLLESFSTACENESSIQINQTNVVHNNEYLDMLFNYGHMIGKIE